MVYHDDSSLSAAKQGAFEGRIRAASATQLRLEPFGGRGWIEVNGALAALGDLQLGYIECLSTAFTIDASGLSTGAAPAADTFHYVYVSNRWAFPFPGQLRLSTVAPTLYNGVEYLGSSSNAAEWRLVGWVMTSAGAGFEFIQGYGAAARALIHVSNRYNQAPIGFQSRPLYTNNGANTFFDCAANVALQPINAGTNDSCSVIVPSNTNLFAHGGCISTGTTDGAVARTQACVVGIGVGTTLGDAAPSTDARLNWQNPTVIPPNVNAVNPTRQIEGRHFARTVAPAGGVVSRLFLSLNCFNENEQVRFYGDSRPHGANLDMLATWVGGWVMQ